MAAFIAASVVIGVVLFFGLIRATEWVEKRRSPTPPLPVKPQELIIIREDIVTRRQTLTIKAQR